MSALYKYFRLYNWLHLSCTSSLFFISGSNVLEKPVTLKVTHYTKPEYKRTCHLTSVNRKLQYSQSVA